MAVLPLADKGVAIDALRSDRPVVMPWPSPLPYALTGRRAAALNMAKNVRHASRPD